MCNYILKENLIMALTVAIEKQQRNEKFYGYRSDSGMLAAWKENLKHLVTLQQEARILLENSITTNA